MAKKSARIRTTFNILNIKLRQPDAKESTARQYADFFMKMAALKSRIKLSPELGAVVRRCQLERVGGQQVIVGFIAKYTIIANGRWLKLDDPDADEIDVPIPGDTAANSKDTAFFFVPANHRLALKRASGSLTAKQAKLFFERAFEKVLAKNQHLDIDISPSEEQYQRIVKSNRLSRLQIVLTYSNNDLNEEFAELIDGQLKATNTNRFDLTVTAERGELLDIRKSSFIEGALALARENGVVEATEVGPNGRRYTIRPTNHPRQETVISEQPSDLLRDVSATLLHLFPRPSSSNSNDQ